MSYSLSSPEGYHCSSPKSDLCLLNPLRPRLATAVPRVITIATPPEDPRRIPRPTKTMSTSYRTPNTPRLCGPVSTASVNRRSGQFMLCQSGQVSAVRFAKVDSARVGSATVRSVRVSSPPVCKRSGPRGSEPLVSGQLKLGSLSSGLLSLCQLYSGLSSTGLVSSGHFSSA